MSPVETARHAGRRCARLPPGRGPLQGLGLLQHRLRHAKRARAAARRRRDERGRARAPGAADSSSSGRPTPSLESSRLGLSKSQSRRRARRSTEPRLEASDWTRDQMRQLVQQLRPPAACTFAWSGIRTSSPCGSRSVSVSRLGGSRPADLGGGEQLHQRQSAHVGLDHAGASQAAHGRCRKVWKVSSWDLIELRICCCAPRGQVVVAGLQVFSRVRAGPAPARR